MPQEPEQSTVTLATIAAHLGVSRSTVSNAYNHPDQLSESLRERIFETARSLGYNGPDPVARRLRQGRAGAIGVLFSEPLHTAFTDPASVLFLQGVATAGEEADSGVLLIPARPSPQSAAVVQDAMVDGFILYSIPPGHPFVDAALRRHVPVVCVDQKRIGGTAWVGIDDRTAAREAAQHLIDLGHRKIGVLVYGLGPSEEESVTSSGATCPSVSWLRMDGWKDAFDSAGIAWSDAPVEECISNTQEDGARAAKRLLEATDPPTAFLCSSDELALGVMAHAHANDIDVPGDIAVVGFNDVEGAGFAGLTTVKQPLAEKGERAARLLLEGSARGDETISMNHELIVRRSTVRT